METGELLEPLLRWLRTRMLMPYLTVFHKVLDIGCGTKGDSLKKLSDKIGSGVGIDIGAESYNKDNIEILKSDIDGATLPFESNSFDRVIMTAILEHLNNRVETMREVHRVLKPGGKVVLTAPSWAAKPILEFLAYKLRIVSREGIDDHKTYFWKSDLMDVLTKAGFDAWDIKHKYFEFGLNNFVVAMKEN